jgi:hypothetical protein
MSQKISNDVALVAKYQNNFVAFAADLYVPIGGKIARFGDVWTDEQQRIIKSLEASLLAVARGDVPPIPRYWLEATKGWGKDLICCIDILWLLLFAPRAVRIQVGAYDAAQAGEQRLIAKQILNADGPTNRLAAKKISVQKDCLIAHAGTPGRTESICEILTSDAYGSHGARPDMVICNELTHVASEAFMQTLNDNAAKVPCCLVKFALNAGELGTYQWTWRENAIADPERWHVEILNYPAPWINAATLREAEKRNPRQRFLRLYHGVWSSGSGDCIAVDKIKACTTLREPHTRRRANMLYLGGLDLAYRKDHAALVVVAVNIIDQVVELASVQSWAPSQFETGEIDLTVVQVAVAEAKLRYNAAAFVFDPFQSILLAQQLRADGITMIEYPFTPKAKEEMAKSLLEAFNNQRVRLYPDDEFAADLLRLRIKENSFGKMTLDAIRDANGHADKATAFACVLPHALAVACNGLPDCVGSDDHAEVLVPV